MIQTPPSSAALPTSSTTDSDQHRTTGSPQTGPDDVRLLASVDRSHVRWRRLWLRLQSITPSGAMRGLLVVGAAAAVTWFIASAWYILVPFQVGLALAYITLPLVNRLDRVMPRILAVLLVVLLQLGAVFAFFGGLIPPLVDQLGALVGSLPGVVDVRVVADRLREWVGTLPPQVQTAILDASAKVTTFLRENAPILAQRALELLILGSFTLLDWLGFLIGFLAIPTFLFAVMHGQPSGVRAVNRAVPAAMRQDFWAVLRIVDRTLSAYLRGQLLRSFVYGAAVASGLAMLSAAEYIGATYPLVLGVVAAVTYLIPNIGWLIGTIPAVLLALTESRETAGTVFALYVGLGLIESRFLAPRIESRSADVHPAILMPALVAASQVNLLLVILAAPLIVVARDLFKYAYGRLSDPAEPAGVLPGEQHRLTQGRRALAVRASRRSSRWSGAAYPPPLDGR